MCVCVCVCCVCERVGSDVLQFLFPGTVRCNEERRVMKDDMTRTGYSDVNGPAISGLSHCSARMWKRSKGRGRPKDARHRKQQDRVYF